MNNFSPILYIKSKLGLIHRHNYKKHRSVYSDHIVTDLKCKDCGYILGLEQWQFNDYCPTDKLYCSLKEAEKNKNENI